MVSCSNPYNTLTICAKEPTPFLNFGTKKKISNWLNLKRVKNWVLCVIQRSFNAIMHGVLRLQDRLLKVPELILDNCTDNRWRWFKKHLGALDGTYIRVRVPKQDKPRYRTQKGVVTTNVLGVCVNVCILRSASNSRVL
ncbi:hypothetical protein PRUPE_6G061200 [Prunus persica]|uniref:DDE Tnp4 domain-containing protein n=1 Tax=Prunus persica TaxID=3760 RepID=A0A251NL10_PRUPE|nr:hypothetical protein PRUPE_6G061200 [Prunus persica]